MIIHFMLSILYNLDILILKKGVKLKDLFFLHIFVFVKERYNN